MIETLSTKSLTDFTVETPLWLSAMLTADHPVMGLGLGAVEMSTPVEETNEPAHLAKWCIQRPSFGRLAGHSSGSTKYI